MKKCKTKINDLYHLNDAKLAYLLKKGDAEAGSILFNRYKSFINVVVKVFIRKNQIPKSLSFDDLLSEANISFLLCIQRCTNFSSFKSYLKIAILRNLERVLKREFDDLKRRGFSLDDYLSYDDSLSYGEIVSEETINSNLYHGINLEINEKSLKLLNNEERDIILLKTKGHKIKEIADILKIKETHVKYVLKSIKHKFNK